MSSAEMYGSDWTVVEVDAVVDAYLEMLSHELAGRLYIKADYNRHLQKITGRTRGAIEYKLENISAVFQRLGRKWIQGYKPFPNFQSLLLDTIERRLSTLEGTSISEGFGESEEPADISSVSSLVFVEPPKPEGPPEKSNELLEKLVRKFDPATRDARNRALGKRGEELVLRREYNRLVGDRPDLARQIDWVSDRLGDGAGYDIRSFELDGRERLIEVKTTIGYERTPFYLTANEFLVSEERPEIFKLIRVYDFGKRPKAFELAPPLSAFVQLLPQVYRATPL